jgi:hypothetical protein
MKKLLLIFSAFILGLSPSKAQDFAANNPVVTAVEPIASLVFPNPAVNSTTVLLSYTPMRRVIIDIVDFNGNIRRSYAFAPGGNRFTVDVGFLEQGYYVLRVREGAALLSRTKLIKG